MSVWLLYRRNVSARDYILDDVFSTKEAAIKYAESGLVEVTWDNEQKVSGVITIADFQDRIRILEYEVKT